MKLLIDDAHIDLIKKICDYYPVDGVTTNPSILAKSGRQPFEILKEIRSFIGKDAEQMCIRESYHSSYISPTFIIIIKYQ